MLDLSTAAISNLVDAAGDLKVEVVRLEKQLQAIRREFADRGPGEYSGTHYRLLVTKNGEIIIHVVERREYCYDH